MSHGAVSGFSSPGQRGLEFVDIHSHILPGLDDGAASLEEATAMMESARRHGTGVLVATPHANPVFAYDRARTEQLLDSLRARAPSGLHLIRGCDFHLTFTNVEQALRSPADFAINGRCWLLMELSDLTIFSNTGALWRRLEDAGLRIILTHPERNALLRQRFDLIEQWVSEGRYMQVTAGSLLGAFGNAARRFAIRLLEAGLVHFVASDAHDVRHRPARLDLAWQWLVRRYGQEYARRLVADHPRCAVEGLPLDLEGFRPPRRLPFWRRWIGGKREII
ncbi:MAG: tyrosine-protein phosphatase [Acidobacteriota bacterium]